MGVEGKTDWEMDWEGVKDASHGAGFRRDI
jgi:hypothetical protein